MPLFSIWNLLDGIFIISPPRINFTSSTLLLERSSRRTGNNLSTSIFPVWSLGWFSGTSMTSWELRCWFVLECICRRFLLSDCLSSKRNSNSPSASRLRRSLLTWQEFYNENVVTNEGPDIVYRIEKNGRKQAKKRGYRE